MEPVLTKPNSVGIRLSRDGKIHCMGVGGIGVSGLAMLLAADGASVSGCDLSVAPRMRRWLEKAGVRVLEGHSARHLAGVGRLIATPAVAGDNAELQTARRRGIAVQSRGEALAGYANARATVAVCGTHGKTTTSCFAASLLRALMPRAGCGWCIGGWTESLGCVARPPANAGAPFVVEADESDGTLALYAPRVAVVTSVERDHLENFASFDALAECFAAACRAATDAVVFCADDPVCRRVAAESRAPSRIGYGFSDAAALRAVPTGDDAGGQSFDLTFNGRRFAGLRLPVPGRHNVLNALGAVGAAIALGVPPERVALKIGSMRELPHRRYERIRCRGGFEVVSDYSHHPTEIRALLETAKRGGRPVMAIFQPHRLSRTRALMDSFPEAFAPLSADGAGAPDRLILLPVYTAFEKPAAESSSFSLYAALREAQARTGRGVVPELAGSMDEVFGYLRRSRALFDQYNVLFVGAGSIGGLVERLRNARGFRDCGESPIRVSYGVPAFADEVVEVGDAKSLSALLASRRQVRAMGQGTNLLPPALGVRGTVVRLSNCEVVVVRGGDAARIAVGCGISGTKLLAELARMGLSGLEFMAGIPGTLGGWLAMNAGTRYGQVGDAVASVVAFGAGGRRFEAGRGGCGFSYRRCAFLEGRVAFSAELELRRDDPDAILSRMRGFLERRFDFGGMRTAGSVFKNPPGAFAGALLEHAGCKGLRVGGAEVSGRHANIIAARPGATASDIIALRGIMRERVAFDSGTVLESEIQTWQNS